MHSRKKVSYYYDGSIGDFYYGPGHPMKPQRIKLAHHLILNYGLYTKMEIYRPFRASDEDMEKYHSAEYVKFLKSVTPHNLDTFPSNILQKYCIGSDCPLFEGIYDFSSICAGGSLAAAIKLNKKQSDICINWAGGLHHAKPSAASGFCYINDIVLAILELLKYHQRVLYVDIDVHHGDGVEEAFYLTDRVMTISLHKYGNYFPGTGNSKEVGAGKGKYYSVNLPLKPGVTDELYHSIFIPVIEKAMSFFQPSIIVLQCGADSLAGDRLGSFNLSSTGHSQCVEFILKYNLPVMIVGGGGYKIRNVSRCWAKETALALNMEIPEKIPYNDYFAYFAPDYQLEVKARDTLFNQNDDNQIRRMIRKTLQNLSLIPHAPSVQVQDIPQDAMQIDESRAEDMKDPDLRLSQEERDRRIQPDNEYSDSENEGEGNRRDNRSFEKP